MRALGDRLYDFVAIALRYDKVDRVWRDARFVAQGDDRAAAEVDHPARMFVRHAGERVPHRRIVAHAKVCNRNDAGFGTAYEHRGGCVAVDDEISKTAYQR